MNKKIFYLDNLRLTLAVFVVAWHSANAYIGIGWSVSEAGTSYFVNFFKTIFDSFTMPLFFYISGYFSFLSVKKYGFKGFVANKARTVLLPWFFGILLIVPFIKFIGELSENSLNQGYFDVWKHEMGRFLRFDTGLVADAYYQRYMWFLSFLFVLFCLLAFWYLINSSWFVNADVAEQKIIGKKDSARFWIRTSLLFFVPMFFVQILVLLFADGGEAEPFISVFNLLQFQSTRLPIYIIIFVLGLLTQKNNWIERGLFDQTNWIGIFAVTGVLYLLHTNVLNHVLPDVLYGPLFLVFITAFIASSLGFSMFIFKRFFYTQISWDKNMPSYAFNIYIIHYPIVYGLQALFLKAEVVPHAVKFICVTLIGLIASYAISRFLMKSHPKTTLLIGIAGTILLFVTT